MGQAMQLPKMAPRAGKMGPRMQTPNIPPKITGSSHSVSRLVRTPTREITPKYQAETGVDKAMALRLTERESAATWKSLEPFWGRCSWK